MLYKQSDPISECLRRAEECRRRARTAFNKEAIKHYLKMEQRWLFLAQSHQFAERVQRFIRSRGRTDETQLATQQQQQIQPDKK